MAPRAQQPLNEPHSLALRLALHMGVSPPPRLPPPRPPLHGLWGARGRSVMHAAMRKEASCIQRGYGCVSMGAPPPPLRGCFGGSAMPAASSSGSLWMTRARRPPAAAAESSRLARPLWGPGLSKLPLRPAKRQHRSLGSQGTAGADAAMQHRCSEFIDATQVLTACTRQDKVQCTLQVRSASLARSDLDVSAAALPRA